MTELLPNLLHQEHQPVHPGELIREDILPEIKATKAELAGMLNISCQILDDILREKQSITAEMALKLGKLFGNGPILWLNLQQNYDLHMASKNVDLSKIPTLGENRNT